METKPWYQSTILQQQIIQMAVAILGLLGLSGQIDVEGTVQAIFVGIGGVVAVITFLTRIFKSHKPITQSVAAKEAAAKTTQLNSHWAVSLLILAVFSLPFLGGCSILGTPTPQTFNERLAVGYGTVTSLRNLEFTIAKAKITEAASDSAKQVEIRKDAQNIQDQLDKAREGLDVAAGLAKVDMPSAEERLDVTLQILDALKVYLEAQQ